MQVAKKLQQYKLDQLALIQIQSSRASNSSSALLLCQPSSFSD
jgi:hypothetical protein